MPKFTLAALLLACLLVSSAARSGEVLNLPHKTLRLPNGFSAYLIRYPSPGAVAYQLTVHAGSRNEVEKGKTGFAHFFEHLMFRGTKNRSSKEFGALYMKLGCENNAFTADDMTAFHGVVASVYLPQILEAEADRFANLSFDEKNLRDEAGAVLGEFNKDAAQPEFVLEEKLMATAFTVHPYSHTTMGYREDVVQFPERYKDVWPFFNRYYRPENVTLTLVGDFNFDSMEKAITRYFGPWKKEPVETPAIPAEPAQDGPRQLQFKIDKPTQTRITVAYKVPAFTTRDENSAALNLLSEILFSPTSEFQKEYRYRKKWLDSVDTDGLASVDPGLWRIDLRLSQAGEGKDDEILAAVEATIAGVRTTPPTTARLKATQKRIRNSALTQWFASPEGLLETIATYTNFEPDLGVLDRLLHDYDQATPETLTAFAKQHLIDSQKTTVILKGASK